jgi:hypothetical protein
MSEPMLIESHEYEIVRFKLHSRTTVEVAAASTGKISVFIVDSSNLRKYEDRDRYGYFDGGGPKTEHEYTVSLNEGSYAVIFDNETNDNVAVAYSIDFDGVE